MKCVVNLFIDSFPMTESYENTSEKNLMYY